MTERVLVDSWTVETASGSLATDIYTDGGFTMLVRESRTEVTVMPFAHGEELQRLITALQSAAAYTGKRT
jgi:hypothetical protein